MKRSGLSQVPHQPVMRRFRLDQGQTQHFFLFGELQGPDTAQRSIEQLARPIEAKHNLFGKIELNEQTFRALIKNFNDGVYGQDIYLDRNHNIDAGVQGTIKKLFMRDGRLLAEIEWTELGVQTFQRDGFKYFSIDFSDDYIHPETGKNHGPVLFGAALTPRPFIKNMKPSQGPGRQLLSEGRSVFVPDYLRLNEEATMKLSEFLKQLREKLMAKKLAQWAVDQLVTQAEATCKTLAEGSPLLTQLYLTLEAEAIQLAEHFNGKASALHLNAEGRFTKDELQQMISEGLSKQLADLRAAEATAATTLATNRKAFTDAIAAEKGLSDATKQMLTPHADAITGNMTLDQVQRLAASAVKLGNQMEVGLKKAAIGLSVPGQLGSLQVLSDIGTSVHGFMRERLLLTDAFANKHLKCPEEKNLSSFTRKVLSAFDQIHGQRLDAEHKLLAGDGSTNVADGAFPVVAQRQVILELLADNRFMDLVQTLVDPAAQATIQIPYEERNTAGILNGAVTYEGKVIKYAGVVQKMDQAWVLPRKIALMISNEMIHFTRVSAINWDAWARNISSNARLMRDIICAGVMNEIVQASDLFTKTDVVNEALTAQTNGARQTFKSAQFPIVRPRQPKDLQGNNVGTLEAGIVVTYNGGAIAEYDGTGTQAGGNYYRVTDYNLGYLQIVNQLGVLQTPANATPFLLTYSYTTNVQKFDIDVPGGVDLDFHYNGLLNAFGDRKALLDSARFVKANFSAMSSTLHNAFTKARQFAAQSSKQGTNLDVQGDLAEIKGISAWGTNQPGSNLGDTRVILGERGNTSYGVAKPFATGMPFEVIDGATGHPTGQKQAYGEEYSTIHTPKPVRGRYTSLVAYSVTARAAV